jgi:holin-like protein
MSEKNPLPLCLAGGASPDFGECFLSFAAILLLGTVAVYLTTMAGLPIPGSILGLGTLFFWLLNTPGSGKCVEFLFDRSVPHMPLLFVPAGSGILTVLDQMRADWLPIGLAILIGTPLTMALVALFSVWILPKGDQYGA